MNMFDIGLQMLAEAAPAAGPSRRVLLPVVLTIVLLLFVTVALYYARYSLFPSLIRRESPAMPREANARMIQFMGTVTISAILLLTVIWWRWIV